MTFRDESERAAWSSAWDARSYRATSPFDCRFFADAKIEKMRERMPEFDRLKGEPAPFPKPEAPGTISGVKPMDPLSGLAKAMDPAPNTGNPPPGGGRIHYAIQRGAELAWTRMWTRRLHLSHCNADKGHVIDCIYDAMVESVVEHQTVVDTAKMGDTSSVNQCAPGVIQPTRSERPALERVRAAIWREANLHRAPTDAALFGAIGLIDAELSRLSRQPEPEMPAKVKAVIEAARTVVEGWGGIQLSGAYGALINAVTALDEGSAK